MPADEELPFELAASDELEPESELELELDEVELDELELDELELGRLSFL